MSQPNLSTYGGFLRDPGYAGQLVDDTPHSIDSFINEAATAIDFGNAVARGSKVTAGSTLGCKAPATDSDVMIGLAVRFAIKPVQGPGDGGTNTVQYAQNEMVPVLRRGKIYAIAVENVAAGDKVVAITAQNGALGSQADNPASTMDATVNVPPNEQAFGSITFAAVPSANDTVTLNGTAITFKASSPSGSQVLIGGDVNATALNLYNFLRASSDTQLVKFTYAYTPGTAIVRVVAVVNNYSGNALTLATSNSSAITLSGSTLSGGLGNVGNGTFTIDPTTPILAAAKPGLYKVRCTTAGGDSTGTFTVYDPDGVSLGTYVSGASAFATQIKFTTAAGSTVWAVGDEFLVNVLPAGSAGRVEIAGAYWQTTTPANGLGIIEIVNTK